MAGTWLSRLLRLQPHTDNDTLRRDLLPSASLRPTAQIAAWFDPACAAVSGSVGGLALSGVKVRLGLPRLTIPPVEMLGQGTIPSIARSLAHRLGAAAPQSGLLYQAFGEDNAAVVFSARTYSGLQQDQYVTVGYNTFVNSLDNTGHRTSQSRRRRKLPSKGS